MPIDLSTTLIVMPAFNEEASVGDVIREAFRELDEDFDRIENIPMRGFRWSEPARTK